MTPWRVSSAQVVGASILFGQQPDLRFVLGTGVILASVFMYTAPPPKHAVKVPCPSSSQWDRALLDSENTLSYLNPACDSLQHLASIFHGFTPTCAISTFACLLMQDISPSSIPSQLLFSHIPISSSTCLHLNDCTKSNGIYLPNRQI